MKTVLKNVKNWYLLPLLCLGLKQNVNLLFRNGIVVRIPNKSRLSLIFYVNQILAASDTIYKCEDRYIISLKDFKLTFTPNDENDIYRSYLLASLHKSLKIKFFGEDFCEFDFEGRKVKYVFNPHDFTSIANLYSTFVEQQYKALNVEGKIVADIGASYGDTPIYFALKGARRVYAYEPIPWVAKMMLQNIRMNKLQDIVKVFTYAVSAIPNQKRLLCIPLRATDSASLYYKRSNDNTTTIYVETVTPPLDAHVIKIDCEGCEYDIILNWLENKLYEEILIEYHKGYKKLAQKLKELGYKVQILRKWNKLMAYSGN